MSPYSTAEEALDSEAVRIAVHETTCDMAVAREGELEPCDKPAAAVVAMEWDGEWWVWAMCIRHAYLNGGCRNAVPLSRITEEAQA